VVAQQFSAKDLLGSSYQMTPVATSFGVPYATARFLVVL